MSATAQLRQTLDSDGLGRFIVVSNREPFEHEVHDGRIVWTQPAGGVTSALEPLLRRTRGTWVAQGSGAADRQVVDRNSRVMAPPDQPSYTLKRVWIPEPLQRGFYTSSSNRGLWPLCHNVYQRPRFSEADWNCYRRVNELFCESVLEEAGDDSATVFIQDYHLALLPGMLRSRNKRLRLAHFWHIPWPSPEVFSIFPWKEELLDGLLGSDLVAFHLKDHVVNFLHSVERYGNGELDGRRRLVRRDGALTSVRDFPIGIDFDRHCALAHTAKVEAAMVRWKQLVGPDVTVGIGIDRMDYTKGIPERLRALDLLLERQPEWRGKLVFVQIGVPSRGEIPEYQALAQEINREVAATNSRWGTDGWTPIQFFAQCLPAEEMVALHRIATFCLVTPLQDGMNLVAKEFAASREDLDGVLVLSRFAGAAAELDSAILVNPFLDEDIAHGVAQALTTPRRERKLRMYRMRAAVESNTTFAWAAGILSELRNVWKQNARETGALKGLGRARRVAEVSFA